MREQ
jgi:hypothetical protein